MNSTPALFPLCFAALLPSGLQAQDASAWAGFHVGADLSHGTGYIDFGGGDDRDIKGNSYGLHAGYLWSHGALAYGIEASYAKADFLAYVNDVEIPGQQFSNTFDLKARLGYATQRTLVYGLLGYAQVDWEEANNNIVFKNSGPLYGLGVEVLANDTMTFGVEAVWRDLDLEDIDGVNSPNLDTVSLRVGYRF